MENSRTIDALLGEALECLSDAAREIKHADTKTPEENLIDIGRAIAQVWQVRERMYGINPELKPDFLRAIESDKTGYDELSKLLEQAHEAEKADALASAVDLFKLILEKSRFGHFDRCAQAGLYRILSKNKILTND